MSEQSNIKTWPANIYLQHGDSPEVPAFHEVYPGNGYSDGVTWCQDRIEAADVEYVRADLAAAPAQQEPPRVTGEILHACFPETQGEKWPLQLSRMAVWNRIADRVNARLAGEPIQEVKE